MAIPHGSQRNCSQTGQKAALQAPFHVLAGSLNQPRRNFFKAELRPPSFQKLVVPAFVSTTSPVRGFL
jgi:hypothetical protein